MSEDFPQPQWGDAFGATLRRCWEAGLAPGASFEIVERDDGVLSVGEAARYFAGPESWSPIERWACDQATGRVLDVGCGAGRHAVPLAREGYDVIGMDASPGAVDIARERGVEAIVGAVENPPPELRGFDTVLLLGNNLGLLASPQEAPTVLANLAEVTRRGGTASRNGTRPVPDQRRATPGLPPLEPAARSPAGTGPHAHP